VHDQTSNLFRPEALEHHAAGLRRQGALLRISPAWTRSCFWLLLAVVLAGVGGLVFGTLPEYAEGVAVVCARQRTNLTAAAPGTILRRQVHPGDRVADGAVLLEIGNPEAADELRRIEQEWEVLLIDYLKDPSDRRAREALVALRARRNLAEARRIQRRITAPRAGLVGDVRVEAGQRVSAGDVLLSLVHEEESPAVLALLPGRHAPRLSAGATLRLRLDGYEQVRRQELTIDAIGESVAGPGEVRRVLDQEIADSIPVPSSSVLVRAALPAHTFHSGDRTYEYRHGMQGWAEVRLEQEKRLLFKLAPWLERRIEGSDG